MDGRSSIIYEYTWMNWIRVLIQFGRIVVVVDSKFFNCNTT